MLQQKNMIQLDLDEIACELNMTGFRDVEKLPFLSDQNHMYFMGYDEDCNPVQIRVNTTNLTVYARSHTDESYIECNDLEYRPV
ncbi:hypothetical protein [Paenibacillus solani]|uniref:hypothetical protein n=1 Tax=Paenibacillus solani TaxID=1705565 RepID=UPI003D2D8C00